MKFNHNIKRYLFFVLGCLVSSSAFATNSIVYNLRIAETTKGVVRNDEYPVMAVITPFGQLRERYDRRTRLIFAGGLGTLVYLTKTYYFRVDGAVARVVQKDGSLRRGRTQTDDLLFSAGYTYPCDDKTNLTLSFLLGLPTHKDTHLDMGELGYAHIGIGPQLDGAFVLDALSRHSIRVAFRFIHFFPRYISDYQKPIEHTVDFNMGNIIDFFLTYHLAFSKNQFDIGYDANIYNHVRTNCQIAPTFVRNIGYISYKRLFSVCGHPASWDLAFSYASDAPRSSVNYRHLVTGWTSLGFDF